MKNKNANDLMAKLRFAMHKKLNYCGKCGSLRNEIKFEELPKEAQIGFRPFKNEAKFLYCPNCNEYAMVINE